MSQSRCGLQVNRDITITKDFHNHPRKKQLGCLINGSIKRPGESMITTDLAEDELDNQRELAAIEKKDIAELSFGKLTKGLEALLPAEGTIPALSQFSEADLKLIEPFIEEGLSRGLSGKEAIARAKSILKKIKAKEGIVGSGNPELRGEGVTSFLKKLVNILPVRKIGESVAASISNAFPDSDGNARPIFPGEHHAVVKLPNGRFGRTNYTGPGTRIVERLEREAGGDPPRVLSDKVSQSHDIRYALADADGVSDSVAEDNVRKADLKMLSSLADLKRDKLDRNVNIIPAMIGIRGKVVAENFGLLSRSAFIDPDFKPSSRGIALMKNKLAELEQQGFGRSPIDESISSQDKPFKSKKAGKFSPTALRAFQAAPLARARIPFTSTIGKRNQVPPLSLRTREGTIIKSVPQTQGKLAKFKGPTYLDPQPGTSSTQSLAGIYGSDGRKGVALDRRGNQSSLASRLNPMLNTRAEFRNRRSGVSQTGSGARQTGGYQVPGMASSSGHQMIDISTPPIGRVSQAISRGAGMHGGKGQAGVNPIDVQTGSGALPGTALLKKLGKKVQRRSQKLAPSRKKKPLSNKRNPLFWDEHQMSRIMANQLLPMIAVR